MSPLCHHDAGHHHGLQCILPPYILDWIEETGDAEDAAEAARTRASLALVRRKRIVTAQLIADPDVDTRALGLLPEDGSAIKVYDAHGLPFTSYELPRSLLRSTDDPPVSDTEANQACDEARGRRRAWRTVEPFNGWIVYYSPHVRRSTATTPSLHPLTPTKPVPGVALRVQLDHMEELREAQNDIAAGFLRRDQLMQAWALSNTLSREDMAVATGLAKSAWIS